MINAMFKKLDGKRTCKCGYKLLPDERCPICERDKKTIDEIKFEDINTDEYKKYISGDDKLLSDEEFDKKLKGE